jgi:hypothetical protein
MDLILIIIILGPPLRGRFRLSPVGIWGQHRYRRYSVDTVEFPDIDSDLRDRAVVPELRIAAAGHRFRPL